MVRISVADVGTSSTHTIKEYIYIHKELPFELCTLINFFLFHTIYDNDDNNTNNKKKE